MANSFNGNPCNNCECQDGDIFGDNTLSVDGLAQVTKNEGCSHTVHVEPLIFVDSATVDFSESVSGNVQTVTANANVCAGLDALDSDVKAVGDEYIAINGGVCKKVALDELIAVYTDDTIDGAGTEGDPLSVNACEVLATLPDTGIFDVNDRIVVYDFVDGECKTVDSVPADLPSDLDGNPILASDQIVRHIEFEDGSLLDTDGNGNQILELDCSMQKDSSKRIGIGANAHYYLPETTLHNYNVAGVAPANGTTYNIPAGAIITITNPCSNRSMKFMPVIGNYTVVTNGNLNTGYATSYISNVSVNGGAFGGANTVEHSQFTPTGAAVSPPVPTSGFTNRTYRARYRNDLITIIPAGGSVTYQANGVVTVMGRLGTPTIQYEHNMMISGYGWLV